MTFLLFNSKKLLTTYIGNGQSGQEVSNEYIMGSQQSENESHELIIIAVFIFINFNK